MSATNWLRRASGLYLPGFAGISRFGLGCTCCGEDCTILSTDFNMADGTTLPTGWPTTTGWNIASNKLKGPAAGQITSSVSAASRNFKITVTLGGFSNTYAIVYMAEVYVKVINNFGFTRLSIFKPNGVGGFNECDAVVLGNISSGTLTACVKDDGTACATFSGSTVGCTNSGSSGVTFGLGSGTTAVTFDDFLAEVVSADCQSCGPCPGHLKCGNCPVEFYDPTSVKLTFTGTTGTCCGIDGIWNIGPTVDQCDGSTSIGCTGSGTGSAISWAIFGTTVSGHAATTFRAQIIGPANACSDPYLGRWEYTFRNDLEDCSGEKTLALVGQALSSSCFHCADLTGSTVKFEIVP